MQALLLTLLLSWPADLPYKPVPQDAKLKHAPAFVDSAKLGKEGKQPVLLIEGSLPSSCHHLRLDLTGKPDSKKRIAVKAYSVADPKAMCGQMLQPFSVKVPVKAKKGTYTVVINEQAMGTIEIP
ncbi:MAG: hypothetical protein JST65_06090 [Acidobacteria bacterium]|nr:hypothetical protein [Acidobacteriota bacterium]